ncbi:methyl-accepting chemotaxis sensory transducer [Natranaerovirga hydrolytica]|uniref:Methyl-accepting chemotaxis sensory transducer n=1 Tax=Natranaerovirga hydrolytica TaxID=680378 RepID=A0A4R1MDL4_9FIRM|nr:methyl-accepting chemotaxis protein [Natranaerovirga hydrolytica]TCK90556.1 methyl-accepting chemotaxis sensory transducer [Natranaerovirga hydrolytica]
MHNNSQILEKVNKFNVLLIWIFSGLLTLQAFLVTGIERGTVVFITTFITSIVATLIFIFKINNNIASVIIPLCPAIAGTILAIIDGGSLRIITIYMVTLFMSGLYYNKRSLVIYTLILNGIFLGFYFIINQPLMGMDIPIQESIIQLGMMNIGGVVLFFLAKWGNEYLSSAAKNEEKALSVLKELQETFSVIENTTVNLNSSIGSFLENIEETSKISDSVTKGTYEISKGTEEQTHSLTSIHMMMKKSYDKLKDTREKSKAVEDISSDVNTIVNENGREIDRIKNGMKTISSAVNQSFKTVNELGESLEEINNFLSAITNIAEQTNLLALNAAIEAARAGEAGKGFAVVAEEIRKLSEESNKTANEISNIIVTLDEKASAAIGITEKGSKETVEGIKVVDNLGESITNMVHSFSQMKVYLKEEFMAIEEITSLFNDMESHLESNASVMEEYAATTEEITATMDKQNNNINDMVEIVSNIKKMSQEMESKIKK